MADGSAARGDIRTTALVVLMIVAVVTALQLARALFVPLIIGVLLSYLLEPAVAALVSRKVPRALAAALVFTGTLAAVGATAYGLRHQAETVINRLPDAAQQLRLAIERRTQGDSPVTKVQQAAEELRQLSADAKGEHRKGAPAPPAPARQPFQVADYLWSSSGSLTGFAGDVIAVLFLAFYLLVAGDLFRRRLIEIAGPTLSQKKITLQILDAISEQIGRFLFVRAVISIIVGAGTAAVLWSIGLSQAGVWGVVAGALNVVPYVGPGAVAIGAGIAAFLQFQTLTMALAAIGLTVLVASLEAYVITPWLTSRAGDMNPATVFIGLVFWGWLWGLPGLLLAIPLLMVIKSIAEHVEALEPVAVLLRK
jgi:predicted PurR-regulated permease PerM